MAQKQNDKILELAQEVFQNQDGLKDFLELLLNQVMGEEVTAHVGAKPHERKTAGRLSPEFIRDFQSINLFTLANVLVKNFIHIFRLDFLVPNTIRVNDDDRAHSARAKTSGIGNHAFSKQPFLFNPHRQLFKNGIRTCFTAGTSGMPRRSAVGTH